MMEEKEWEGIGAFDIENRFRVKIRAVEDDKDELILRLFNGKDLMGLLRKGGRLTLVMQLKPDTPPSPPAEPKLPQPGSAEYDAAAGNEFHPMEAPRPEPHPTCDKCGKPDPDYSEVDSGGVWWFHDACRPRAEMPEVEPAPPNVTGGAPIILGVCKMWFRVVGDKKANTCDGCKIAGCAMSGRVDE